MKLPDPPKEEQTPEQQADETPQDAEQPKRHPRFGFYRETMKNPPTETGKKPASMIGGQSAPRASNKKPAVAVPTPKAEMPGATPPEPTLLAETQPAGPDRSPGTGIPLRAEDENNPGRR